MKRSCLAVVAAIVLLTPISAIGAERAQPAFPVKLVDVAVIRPLAMVGSIASSALAVGLSPLTWMTGVGDESVHYLVAAPWRFTAHRYPGEFADYKDGRSATGMSLHP